MDRGFKNGLLDEFYLYDRAISGSEIEKLAGLREKIIQQCGTFFEFCPYPECFCQGAVEAERRKFGDQRKRLAEIMVMKEMPGVRETYPGAYY